MVKKAKKVPVTVKSSTRIRDGNPTKVLELDVPIAEVLVPVRKSAKPNKKQFVKIPFECKIVGYDDLFEPIDGEKSISTISSLSCGSFCGGGDVSRSKHGSQTSCAPFGRIRGGTPASFNSRTKGTPSYSSRSRPGSGSSTRTDRGRDISQDTSRVTLRDGSRDTYSDGYRDGFRDGSLAGSRDTLRSSPSYSKQTESKEERKRRKEEEKLRRKEEKRRKNEMKKRQNELKKEMKRLEKQRKKDEKRRRAEAKQREKEEKRRRRPVAPDYSSSRDSFPDSGRSQTPVSGQGVICTRNNRCFSVSEDEMCKCQCPECCCRPGSATGSRVTRSASNPEPGPKPKNRKSPGRGQSSDSDVGSRRPYPSSGRPISAGTPGQPKRENKKRKKRKPSCAGFCGGSREDDRDSLQESVMGTSPERPYRDTLNLPHTSRSTTSMPGKEPPSRVSYDDSRPRSESPSKKRGQPPSFLGKICMKNNLFAGTCTKTGKSVENSCTYEDDLEPPLVRDDGRPVPRGKCFMKRCRDNRLFPKRYDGMDEAGQSRTSLREQKKTAKGVGKRDSRDSTKDDRKARKKAEKEAREAEKLAKKQSKASIQAEKKARKRAEKEARDAEKLAKKQSRASMREEKKAKKRAEKEARDAEKRWLAEEEARQRQQWDYPDARSGDDIERARSEALIAAQDAQRADDVARKKAQVAQQKEDELRRLLEEENSKKRREPNKRGSRPSSAGSSAPVSRSPSVDSRPYEGWKSNYGKGRLVDDTLSQKSSQPSQGRGGRGGGGGPDGGRACYGGEGGRGTDRGRGGAGRGRGEDTGYGKGPFGDEDARSRGGDSQRSMPDEKPPKRSLLDRICFTGGSTKAKKPKKAKSGTTIQESPSKQSVSWKGRPGAKKQKTPGRRLSAIFGPREAKSRESPETGNSRASLDSWDSRGYLAPTVSQTTRESRAPGGSSRGSSAASDSRGSLAGRPSGTSLSSADQALVDALASKPGLLASLRNMLFPCSTCTQTAKPINMCQEINGTFRIVGNVESGRIDLFVDDTTKRKLKSALQELAKRTEEYAQTKKGIKNSQFKKD